MYFEEKKIKPQTSSDIKNYFHIHMDDKNKMIFI